ncbi:hypothetical protein B8W69_23580 [Mycobacterium vulneris]|jgi:hypothetical protein|uniref:Uncharacterized protein n=1 Tax=Mycolicibacterium vulneris TaxID=547163 RepID=A0A1X2KPK3_9MYCO|nr:hypothetical protein [Mycolicibacterium vulneris]OSC23689.1 hypothetical protein B8W69_23580 [Mycolicibacterium vulneris]
MRDVYCRVQFATGLPHRESAIDALVAEYEGPVLLASGMRRMRSHGIDLRSGTPMLLAFDIARGPVFRAGEATHGELNQHGRRS